MIKSECGTHYYDSDKYSSCPYCNHQEEKTMLFRKNKNLFLGEKSEKTIVKMECNKGHLYDVTQYDICPYCEGNKGIYKMKECKDCENYYDENYNNKCPYCNNIPNDLTFGTSKFKMCNECEKHYDFHINGECPYCVEEITQVRKITDLDAGTMLFERRYIILETLGVGTYIITYKVYDRTLREITIVQEYFPKMWAYRVFTHDIHVYDEFKKVFSVGLENFSRKMKILKEIEHQNIVKIQNVFSDNDTIYRSLPYISNYVSLGKYSQKNLSENEIIDIAIQVLKALQVVHDNDFLHLNITLETIGLEDSKRVLIQTLELLSVAEILENYDDDISIDNVINGGYSAPEQYESDRSKQGTWTDIYSLGMVLYRLITGEDATNIPASPDRVASYIYEDDDPLQKIESDQYSQGLINIVEKMTKLNRRDRPQNCNEVLKLISKI